MSTPEVSIITPVYNGLKYLDQVWQSIKNQTFTNYEWIVIDDCSTDETREKLSSLALSDERIIPVFLERNSGPIVARNKGMDVAKGRFIAFLDADDLWTEEKLAKQTAFMKEHDIALSYTAFRKINDDGSIKSRVTIPVPRKVTYKKLLASNSIPASSAMFDRWKTGDIRQDTEAPVSKDDFFFWLGILKNHGYAMGLNEDLFRLRIHGDSITGNKLEMAKRHWKMYREIFQLSILKSLSYYFIYSIKGFAKYLM